MISSETGSQTNGPAPDGASGEKRRIAIISFFVSLAMTLAKLLAALFSGSLGLLSEALHNLVDTGATAVTWYAVSYADQPPDEEHHYGHAKAESVAALIEAGLLFLAVAWIVMEAASRLFGSTHGVELTWWMVGLLIVSIAVDYNRSQALRRAGRETNSAALKADALHFASDMWSSLFVLAGLVGVWLGFSKADSIAALIVAGFIAAAAWTLARETISTLLDQAPAGVAENMRALVEESNGVLRVEQLRLKSAGPTLFTSLVVDVARTMPVDAMTALKRSLEERISQTFPNSDVTVTLNPIALDNETVFQRILLITAQRGLSIHHLNVQQLKDKLAISFDLEVDGAMTLAKAHDQATDLETAIRSEFGPNVEVESHIEPQPEYLLTGHDVSTALYQRIEMALRQLARRERRMKDIHSLRIRRNDNGIFVHYHCRFAPDTQVDVVHTVVDRVENGLQAEFPRVVRVIAHTEPVGYQPHAL